MVDAWLDALRGCANMAGLGVLSTGVGVMRHTPYSHAEISCASVIPSRSIRTLVKPRGHRFKMSMLVNGAM